MRQKTWTDPRARVRAKQTDQLLGGEGKDVVKGSHSWLRHRVPLLGTIIAGLPEPQEVRSDASAELDPSALRQPKNARTFALTQLCLGADYSEAARCCGVSCPTLHRWMQQDLYLRDRMMFAKEVGKRFGRRPGND